MNKLLQWITQDVWRAHAHSHAAQADGYSVFEHVDGTQLRAGDVRVSGSMCNDDLAQADFSETVPAYLYAQPRWTSRAL